jgi:hypothetical protein
MFAERLASISVESQGVFNSRAYSFYKFLVTRELSYAFANTGVQPAHGGDALSDPTPEHIYQ